jgi:uncharacterized membrane protein HdeD (DUF308 family)
MLLPPGWIHWRWNRIVFLGVINLLIGLLLLGSPLTAALAVPLVFGVLLLIQGVALIILGFRVRTA